MHSALLQNRRSMTKSRDNHYVPQWYQHGFIEPGRGKLKYLDLKPKLHPRPDGTKVPGRQLFDSATSQCFHQEDLYSTVFGFHIDDEIERRLFGEIDGNGAPAVRAFQGGDVNEWMKHFKNLFEFIDAQKLRTPKGLDWLRLHYPFLDQNQLMFEMQGVRMMHCTLWSESVREIVSAEDAGVKFLITDHPVTAYNYAVPPGDERCAYPNDPPIAWKATQTIYPLNRDYCLILSNLEYTKERQLSDPRRKRTNARNFRSSLIRTDAFIRTRRLSDLEVSQINYILKARANRYIAAGQEAWLYPERTVTGDWSALRTTLLPKDELWRFGGEIYVGYEDGSSSYQDEFGRSEPPSEHLTKPVAEESPRSKDYCGCGSGKTFRDCCKGRPIELRPSWTELSIRERNIIHARAISKIIGLTDGKDWTEARRGLTDEKIVEIYTLFRALWPPDTDLISLLPKPDGRLRALFTGLVDPRTVIEYALGSANYFGEVLIQNPFQHPSVVRREYNPTEQPAQYRLEALKSISLLLDMMPLITAGIVNFFPDPCHFDYHLRQQMMHMAKARTAGVEMTPDARAEWLHKDDFARSMWSLGEESQRAMIREALPKLTPDEGEDLITTMRERRHLDPLAPLQPNPVPHGPDGGLLNCFHMVPNFEMSLFLAQATGSIVVTDSPQRWRELVGASRAAPGKAPQALATLRRAIGEAEHRFLGDQWTIADICQHKAGAAYRALIGDVFRYLTVTSKKGGKPNWESQLPRRFAAAHAGLQDLIGKAEAPALIAKVQCIIPSAGIRDNTINRLLLTSSVDHYLDAVPIAFFLQSPDPSIYDRAHLARPSPGSPSW